MKKDKIHYAYLRMIIEGFEQDDERGAIFHQANIMAHNGESMADIHQHLVDNLGHSYHADAITHWYARGGENPNNQYLRKMAHVAVGEPTTVQLPKIQNVEIHSNIIHKPFVNWFNSVPYKKTQLTIQHKLPEMIEMYRGVGLPTDHERYVPHSLESWTTHKESAELFSTKSHLLGVENRVYKAMVPRTGIFLSHISPMGGTIPSEESLYGKEEHVVFGHTLKNIERIK